MGAAKRTFKTKKKLSGVRTEYRAWKEWDEGDVLIGKLVGSSQNRKNKWSSPVAIALAKTELGKAMGMSPKKIDHLIGAELGRGFQALMLKPNRLEEILSPTKIMDTKLFLESSRQLLEFYETSKENEQIINEARAFIKNETGATNLKSSNVASSYIDADGTEYSEEDIEDAVEYQERAEDIRDLIEEYRKVDVDKEPKIANNLVNEIFKLTDEIRWKESKKEKDQE